MNSNVPKTMFSLTRDLETTIVSSLDGMDVPEPVRRYRLIPISGCGGKVTDDLEHLEISFFTENNGFEKDDQMLIKRLELGCAYAITDGIAQEQVIVRVA
jgi:hypothetical protein